MSLDALSFRLFLLAAFALIAMGCGEPDVVSYTVPRIESNVKPAASAMPPPSTAESKQKMLGGILLTGQQAWFFKVTADPDSIAKQETAFRKWLESIKIGKTGEPEWELPADWHQLPGNAFRFATIRLGDLENSPELSVTQLPQGDQEDDYLLANVNRWRNQLQLVPWTIAEMKKELESIQAGDQTIHYVALEGISGSGGMTPPFAGGRTPPRDMPQQPLLPEVAPPTNNDMKYTVPEGWEEFTPPSSIQRLAFRMKVKEDKLDVTVTQLGGDAGGMLANVNRWRGQLQLAPISQEELSSSIEKIPTPAGDASLVKIIDTSEPRRAIFVVVISANNATWFIKAQGDAAVAEKETEHLQQFVQSLQLPK